jgi:hypothetical protein
MSMRPNKMQRLVRLNQFREDQANDVLRHAIRERVLAFEKHEASTSAIDALGQWKAQRHADGGMDLSLYTAVLEHENYAMLQADKLKQDLVESEKTADIAQRKMMEAASTTKVSEQRESRQKKHAELEIEKNVFDQISDVWLNNRERNND